VADDDGRAQTPVDDEETVAGKKVTESCTVL